MSELALCPCGRVLRPLNVSAAYGQASPWPACVGCGLRPEACTCPPGTPETPPTGEWQP